MYEFRESFKQGCGSGKIFAEAKAIFHKTWCRDVKRLNFCESGSTLKKEAEAKNIRL